MRTISIMVVGNPSVLRDGYNALFAILPNVRVLNPASDRVSATERLVAETPEVVVLDAGVGKDDAASIISAIRQANSATRCLAICSTVAQVRTMQEIGADSAVVEGISPADLCAVVKEIAGIASRGSE